MACATHTIEVACPLHLQFSVYRHSSVSTINHGHNNIIQNARQMANRKMLQCSTVVLSEQKKIITIINIIIIWSRRVAKSCKVEYQIIHRIKI